ncbi:MAG: transporter substrate-binding domain-containing protein [Streptococcaceae bacterium]|jgi:polar amino acid transport system substrate-binding protein|nr:transporter substrate-binding domain-containing protein [Streptococcaceae bacterium]
MKLKNIMLSSLIGLAAFGLLCACSSSSKKDSASDTSTVKKITVATSGTSNPYEYQENGKMTGFEIDILKKIDAALSDYSFSTKIYKDDAILLALDGNHAQMAMNNFGKTAAREEKYLFSYPLSEGINAIFSRETDNITTIVDLAGKSTEIPTGTNYGDIMENWNKKNPDKKITINYSGNTLADRLKAISAGKIDFLFASKSAAENFVKQAGITGLTDTVPTDLNSHPEFKTYEYFVFPESEKKLQKAVNAEMKKLQADGTLKTLSEKYFGSDQTPDVNQYQ